MWDEYAKDPRMKANIGIRRRLAPLLDNDINQIELFTALLLSLPGSPVLYYGDEIGMGDNIWLGDRDGVRTPMQWTPDRNAGFSSATPGKLHLPAIQDPVYGYQSVNVEAQLENPSSLLHWTRRMIHARRGTRVRARLVHRPRRLQPHGAVLRPRARRRRRHATTSILCVNNLSRFPQPVELDLRRFEGMVPGRAARRRAVPGDRRAALPADAGRLRLLLVPADRARRATEEGQLPVTTRSATALDPTVFASLPGADPLVRRQGPPVRGHRRAHGSASVPGARRRPARGHPPGRGDLRRRADGRRPSSTRCRSRSTPARAPARPRLRRLVGGPRATAGCTPTTPLHDREAMALLAAGLRLAAARDSTTRAGCAFHRLPGHDLDLEAHSTLFSRRAVELLGRVRRGRADEGLPQGHARRQPRHHRPRGAHPGRRRSTSPRSTAGSRRRPATPDGADRLQLAMLQQFLRTATDGWDLALASVRNLFAEAEPARPRGPAVTSPARRPGSARRCARCTRSCASTSPPRPGSAPRRPSSPTTMTARLDAALDVVPGLAAHADAAARGVRRASPSLDERRRPADPRRPAPRPDPAHRRRAGRSSTSRASRPSRWPSGCCPTRRGATSPGCCARFDYAPRVVERAMRRATTPRTTPSVAHRGRASGPSATSNHFLDGLRRRASSTVASSRRCWTPTSPTRPSTRPSTRPATARPGWTIPLQAVARIGAA